MERTQLLKGALDAATLAVVAEEDAYGYDVAYCSNSDMISPERGLQCKAFISVGHDEYWDIRAFRSALKMRDAGVNLLFLSGNSVCWVTPLTPSSTGRPNRIMFRGGPYGGKTKWAEDREKDHGPFPHRALMKQFQDMARAALS